MVLCTAGLDSRHDFVALEIPSDENRLREPLFLCPRLSERDAEHAVDTLENHAFRHIPDGDDSLAPEEIRGVLLDKFSQPFPELGAIQVTWDGDRKGLDFMLVAGGGRLRVSVACTSADSLLDPLQIESANIEDFFRGHFGILRENVFATGIDAGHGVHDMPEFQL